MTEQERIDSIKNGTHLANFKKENITYAMCVAAVEKDGYAIYDVPKELRTKEIYQIAAKTCSNIIDFIPKEYLTKKVCEDIIEIDGLKLPRIPEKWRTEALYLKALCQNPEAFSCVPDNMLTAEFCIKAVKRTGKLEVLQSLPEKNRNTAFYLELLEVYPKVFTIIPKKYRTATVCRKAIEKLKIKSVADEVRKHPFFFALLHPALYDHDTCLAFVQTKHFSHFRPGPFSINDGTISDNGFIIPLERFLRFPDVAEKAVSQWNGYFEFVPEKAMTPELCKLAINQNAMALEYVPDSLLNEQLCKTAVSKIGKAIRFVPEKMITPELCVAAIQNDPKTIELIPEGMRTKDLLELAFSKYPQCIGLFPDEYKTEDICMEAVSNTGGLLKSVPVALRTYDICYAAAVHGSGAENIPETLIDKKIALAIIESGNFSVKDTIPFLFTKIPDQEIYLSAVKKKGESLKYIPEESKTYEMCLAAMNNTLSAVYYIPDDMFSDEIRSIFAKNWVPWVGKMFFPEKHQTSQMWLEIFSRHDCCVHYVLSAVPKGFLTQEICDVIVRNSYPMYREIPEEFISEDMIIYMAKTNPGQLGFRFPERFRTEEFVKSITDKYPATKMWLHKAGIGNGWFEYDEK